jgi:ribonuclease Z
MMEIVLLGTGNPLPDPDRAGPATLIRAGGTTLLVDAGRGVLMRAAAVGVSAGTIDALLVTHLHSDHITDLGDLITSRWVMSFEPQPLQIIGPPGIKAVVNATVVSLAPDVGYRLAHHEDLNWAPPVEVHEVTGGICFTADGVTVTAGLTDHRPVEPTIGFRIEHGGKAVVAAGDTVPCDSLDDLCRGADAIVHTALRSDILAELPLTRLQEVCDYHSSVEQAAATAKRAGANTLILTHYVPALTAESEPEWRARAATEFDGTVELGDDLHRVVVQ